jgi:hypothetical protein
LRRAPAVCCILKKLYENTFWFAKINFSQVFQRSREEGFVFDDMICHVVVLTPYSKDSPVRKSAFKKLGLENHGPTSRNVATRKSQKTSMPNRREVARRAETTLAPSIGYPDGSAATRPKADRSSPDPNTHFKR